MTSCLKVSKVAEKRNAGFELDSQLEPCFPTTRTVAPFIAALGIMLTKQAEDKLSIESKNKYIDPASLRTLRLACKAVRNAIDAQMRNFSFPDDLKLGSGNGMGANTECFLRSVLPWRWINLTNVELGMRRLSNAAILQRDVEELVALPLPKLKSLSIHCWSVLPLAQSCNWPELTCLKLAVVYYKRSPKASYPRGLKFPKLPLKALHLRIEEGSNTAFLGSLVKSVSETLSHFEIQDCGSICPMQVANAIASAPLPQLSSMSISSNAHSGFWPKIFSRDWPALKVLSIYQWEMSLVPLLLTQTWFTGLESLELMHCNGLTADELRNFLLALKRNASLERLTLGNLNFSTIADGFAGIKLDSLKMLALEKIDDGKEPLFEDRADISTSLNVVFDSCSFPKLEKVAFSSNTHIIHQNFPRWSIPPRKVGKQFEDAFPFLKEISLCLLHISSRDIADFLGFRRMNGCFIELLASSCQVSAKELPPAQLQLLAKLGIDTEQWTCFYIGRVDKRYYEDCMYWRTKEMSDDHFMLTAYATAIHRRGCIPFYLQNLMDLALGEVGGAAMLAKVVALLRTVL